MPLIAPSTCLWSPIFPSKLLLAFHFTCVYVHVFVGSNGAAHPSPLPSTNLPSTTVSLQLRSRSRCTLNGTEHAKSASVTHCTGSLAKKVVCCLVKVCADCYHKTTCSIATMADCRLELFFKSPAQLGNQIIPWLHQHAITSRINITNKARDLQF